MQEARYSFNTKFRYHGFESQFTIREEEGVAAVTIDAGMKAIAWLSDHGAMPTNGNGHQNGAPSKVEDQLWDKLKLPDKPVCPVCGKGDELELVKFERDGKPRSAYKCQRCKKWLK